MAVVPKKTYSRRNNEYSLNEREKENVDPFDELLSSPLKQDVQFKPLSFWDRKVKDLETKKKSKSIKWELYETSNSDDDSPCNRKKNPRSKYSKHKGKTLPLKNISHNKNNVFSTVRSFVKKSKSTKAVATVQNTTLVPCEELLKHKSQSSEDALSFSKNTCPIFNSLHENCDGFNGFKYVGVLKQHGRGNYGNKHGMVSDGFTNPLRAHKNEEKATCSSQIELEKNPILNGVKFKVCEDITSAEENLEVPCDKALIHNEIEESENLTYVHVNKTLEETLKPYCNSDDNYKFISTRRYFNNFNQDNRSSLNGIKGDYESPNNTQNTFTEINNAKDLTFGICKEFNSPGGNSGNSNKDMSTFNPKDDSVTNAKFYNDNNIVVSILNPAAYGDDDETLSADNDEEDIIGTTFYESDIFGKSLSYMRPAAVMNKEMKTLSTVEFQTKTADLDMFSFINDTNNLEDFTQEPLLEWNENSTGVAESSSTSDENPFYLTEEESVIQTGLQSNRSNTLTTEYNVEKEFPDLDSSSKRVSRLTMEISNLSISNAAESDKVTPKPRAEELQIQDNDISSKDAKNNSLFIDLRNVTTKRRYRLNGRCQRGISDADENLFHPPKEKERESNLEREWELNETLEHSGMSGMTDKTNFDWNKTLCFANPIFESTRVQDISGDAGKFEKTLNQSQKMTSLLGESQIWLDHSYALKPGKKWLRSISVLKQIRNGNIMGDRFESTRIKGRKFESFVKDMLEMQTGKSGWSTSVAEPTNSKEASTSSGLKEPSSQSDSTRCRVLESKDSLKDITFKNSSFSVNCSDGTILEASLINPTMRVINPEDKPSILGLKVSNLAPQGVRTDLSNSSGMSGRDFILLQCGQDDVLPFEEYFNERTLKDCKKIGEGVYGEVFRSSDGVIKIIPIEGSDKVNGEPQKTFEEILSEVVIAVKLSNLRNGGENRTDGFSEVKRCWCVKGRYPKYLLRLWDEYDQSGNGSENDSPAMFKDDQLYIILELSNGGRDLESFMFSSASQSLSIFVQTAFSLAAAENAFEFEHRDLHWGNILISETKDKFVTVVLENVEYKIPSKGVKVCIIDFTLSRIYDQGLCIFNDLSVDPTLFTSEGDYQFEIYRMMLREVRNDWSLFRPKTNIFWLHYTLDKMINMVRYKNKKTKLHKKGERDLKILESTVLGYKDTTDFVLSGSLKSVMNRL